jgi:hypothetical protein
MIPKFKALCALGAFLKATKYQAPIAGVLTADREINMSIRLYFVDTVKTQFGDSSVFQTAESFQNFHTALDSVIKHEDGSVMALIRNVFNDIKQGENISIYILALLIKF